MNSGEPSRNSTRPARPMPPWRHSLVVLALALCSAAAAWGLAQTPLLRNLEARTLDYRFLWRTTPAPRDPSIVLVTVDDASLDRISEPMVFWLPHFTRVIRAALDHGARVVGFDFLFRIQTGKFLPGAEEDLARLLLQNPGRVILAAALDRESRELIPPIDTLRYAAGEENLGIINLTRDEDGTWRRQSPYLVTAAGGPGGTYEARYAFGFVLASRFLGQPLSLARGGDQALWKGSPLPLVKGALMVNFAGPPGSFPALPFWKVEERIRAGDRAFLDRSFRDRLVIICPAGAGTNDFVPTPYNASGNPRQMLGAECHANVANTLLTGRFITLPPAGTRFALVLTLVILAAIATYRLSPPAAAAVTVGLGGMAWLIALLRFQGTQTWVDLAAPLLGLPLAYASVSTYRYLVMDSEKRYLRRVFSRYCSTQVVDELMGESAQLEPGGRQCEVTVLFADINDFTTLSERLTPHEVINLLNEFWEGMLEIVDRHQGIPKQFAGDEIMVLFGGPLYQPDQARRAVETAADMIQHLEERQRSASNREGFYKVKIGVNTGPAVVGNIGTEKRADFTVIGDTVNLAARLETLNKQLHTSILVGGETRRQAGEISNLEFVPRGSHQVKGRASEVQVFEVVRRETPGQG